jgi:hypothetical protein
MDIIFFPQISEINPKKPKPIENKKRKKFRFSGKIIQIEIKNDKVILKIVANMPQKDLKMLLNEDVIVQSE